MSTSGEPRLSRSPSRRRVAFLVVATVLSFTVMAGGSSAASLQLGKTNKTNGQTSLTSASKKKAALAVANTGGAAAASFHVKKNKSPFTVNSTAKVKNLNADFLDGLDSSKLQKRVGGTCNPGSAIRIVNAGGGVVCQPLLVSVPPGWNLTGNAGTNPTADFLGTTDAQPLVIRTNNAEAVRVTAAGQVGIGTTTPAAQLQVVGTSASGDGVAASGTQNGVNTNGGQDGVLANGGKDGVEARGTSIGVFGGSDAGIGLEANSGSATNTGGTRGVVGTVNGGSCPGSYGVGGCAAVNDGVLGSSGTGIGVLGNSGSSGSGGTRGVVGTLNNANCPGTYAVGGCGAGVGDGVNGSSSNNGVVGTSSHASGGGTAAGVLGINTGGGDVFIGSTNATGTNHVFRVDSTGKGFFDGGTATSGADYAESIQAVDGSQLQPGDVLAIAPRHGYAVGTSGQPYSQLVVGVYSTKPAVLAVGAQKADSSLSGQVPVAMMGVVPTKVTAAGGAIRPGDLLTTSRVAGYAMKAKGTIVHGIPIYPQATIVGKALEPLSHGQGTIEVMLMSR